MGRRGSTRWIRFALVGLVVFAVLQGVAPGAHSAALTGKLKCSIANVAFDAPLTPTSTAAEVRATGQCRVGKRVVASRWTYSYTYSAKRGAKLCSALEANGTGNSFVLDRLGADSVTVTFSLRPMSVPSRGVVIIRSLKLLKGFNGCGPLALPELKGLVGSSIIVTYTPSTNAGTGVGTVASHCDWNSPDDVYGTSELGAANDNPGFVVSGEFSNGWSATPSADLGNFYPSVTVARTSGEPAWTSAFLALNSPSHQGIKLVASSAEPTPPGCASLATEVGPNGAPDIPIRIGVAASNLNNGWDGIACGYLSFQPGIQARVSLFVTDAAPAFTNSFDLKCVAGKLNTP